jgi:hypothetical protein
LAVDSSIRAYIGLTASGKYDNAGISQQAKICGPVNKRVTVIDILGGTEDYVGLVIFLIEMIET